MLLPKTDAEKARPPCRLVMRQLCSEVLAFAAKWHNDGQLKHTWDLSVNKHPSSQGIYIYIYKNRRSHTSFWSPEVTWIKLIVSLSETIQCSWKATAHQRIRRLHPFSCYFSYDYSKTQGKIADLPVTKMRMAVAPSQNVSSGLSMASTSKILVHWLTLTKLSMPA